MTKINEVQLIESLKQLKEIKPNKEWASLLKSEILIEQKTELVQAKSIGFIETLKFVFAQKKLVYAFSVVLLFVVGTFGMYKMLPTEKLPQQQASLTNQNSVVIREQINATVKGLTQTLKNTTTQNPEAIRTLAKTLADMPGDIASTQDVKDLMQTVVENQIMYLQETTLTDEQKTTINEAALLYNQGKYTEALEAILLINN